MAYVACEVVRSKQGPRERTVAVRSVQGHREYLDVPAVFLREVGPRTYLSVTLVGRDPEGHMALVELPFEADSGANRLWVSDGNLFDERKVTITRPAMSANMETIWG